jgi:Dolichyl-phosphate-mannose-protein mannosyltransferase
VPAESSALPAPLIVTAPPTDARPARWPWIAVGGLVALALALRLACLFYVLGSDFVWHDADAYLAKGARLVESGQFRWTYDAVAYPWGGRIYALPPLFSVYLAPFARFASYPFNAFVGLAVLNALAIPLIVRLGTRLHSLTAGLVGGLLYACWGSDIVGLGQVRQEPLYLPLVIAATLALVRAWDRRGAGPFALAGAAFGLAALCRSMPIYFVAATAGALVLRDRRGAGPREALALLSGFAALTLPYSLALSIHLGQPTLIENHGGILVAARYLHGGNRLAAPGFGAVVAAILREVTTTPLAFVQATLDQARSLLALIGGRYLQDGVFAASASSAAGWKVAAHVFIDVPWLFAIVLAPLGVAVARNRPAAWLLAGWALLNLGLTALTGFGGSRLRCPFEVHVALLASTVVAGGWPSPRRPLALGLGVAGSVAAALLMVPQIARTAAARANYGPRWTLTGTRTVAQVSGASGANVLASPAGLDVVLRNTGSAPIRVDLRVDGVAVVQASVMEPGAERRLEWRAERTGLLFIETSSMALDGQPAPVDVEIDRRPGPSRARQPQR